MPPPDEPSADLGALDLTPVEEAAYELLIDRLPSTLIELAAAWTRPEQLAATLTELEAKGLVHRLPGGDARYAAAAPDLALNALLLDHEQRLHRARAEADRLLTAYREHAAAREPGTIVEVVAGSRAIRQRLTQIRRSAHHQVRSLDKQPHFNHDLPGTHLELLSAGVTCRTVYERASVEALDALPGIEELIHAGEQARVLPRLPMPLYLADDRFAILPLHREPTGDAIIVVHRSALLDALAKLFEDLWKRALPLDLTAAQPATHPATSRRRSTADDKRLIALLLSGLTDQAIARQLGVSPRTIQRRVAALIDDLGVHTRFQAGVQAAARTNAQSSTPGR